MPELPPTHKPKARVEVRKQIEKQRQQKKALIYDSAWRKLRAQFVLDHPFCKRCLADNNLVPTQHVHHVIEVADDPSRRLDVSNLEPMCVHHHTMHHAHKRHDNGTW